MSVVFMDEYGRIRIPRKYLESIRSRRFIVRRSGKAIILLPVEEEDLMECVDSVEVDVDPEAFRDYNELKKVLLGGKHIY